MTEKIENSSIFEPYRIKTYDNWDLFLYTHQHPLIGRCYAWAKRPEADEITDMTDAERQELFSKVLPEWNSAIKELFNHDRPNAACLGNNSPHLHWHMIPRYNTPREFYGIKFEDTAPNRNYVHVKKSRLRNDLDLQIVKDIRSKINSA